MNCKEELFLTPYNDVPEVRNQFTLPKKVLIHDVTIREVMQSPRLCLRPEEKIRVAKALDKMGVYSIENGAYMTPTEKEVTAELVRMHKKGEIKAHIVPLAHWVEKDIDIALETGADRVLMSANGNPVTLQENDGVSPEDALKKLVNISKYAKKNGLFFTAQIYDTYRMPLDYMERVFKSMVYDGGTDSIAISDTFANVLPWTAAWMIRKIKSWVPNTRLEHHGHNDFGMSTAMMIGAITGGCEVVHTSINNIGERVGNAATEEVAMVLELLMHIDTGIDLTQIYPTAELVSRLTKLPISPNKAVIGENVFLQGSGMIAWHQFRWEKMGKPWYNMPFAPQTIGRDEMEVILGVGCGKGIVEHELEKMGISATKEQMGKIADKVKEEAYICKWSLSKIQFRQILTEVLGKEALIIAQPGK